MDMMLPYLYGFVAGAAIVGARWWWIGHRAKARATLATVETVLKGPK